MVDQPPLEGFLTYSFPEGGRPVYWRGPRYRPGVILLHELPGLVKDCVDLARELSSPEDDFPGFQVHLPLLFGQPHQAGSVGDMIEGLWCMRREMSLLSVSRPSPITSWVAALADQVASQSGQPRVGVIGMCLTGSLVFGLVAEPSVGAVVASQPSLPFPVSPKRRQSYGVPPTELQPHAANGAPVMAMRYRDDRACPRQRFVQLAQTYGHRLAEPEEGVRQDETLGKLRIIDVPGSRHAMLTLHRDDRTVGDVKRFLSENLGQS
ncbi:MAG: dienelactone hydrolase family protein [Acidimicrobiia bacterium]|nr:dienelactone hydrolase family protein [Acidimicrobiia bacterium]